MVKPIVRNQVLPLRVRVGQGVMEIKWYTTFPEALGLKLHYQMQLKKKLKKKFEKKKKKKKKEGH